MSDDHGGGGGGKKRRAHEEEHEEHENHERWLVSFADMMTLLMVLFIVMFAISQVDQVKFAALKTGLKAGFGEPVTMVNGGASLLDSGGAIAPDSVNINADAGSDGDANGKSSSTEVDPEAVARLASATERAKVEQEVENLQKAKEKLQEALAKAGMKDKANFRFNERGLVVTVATDNVLFDSGSADLAVQGRRILNVLSPTLKKLPNRLSIEGHTNSIPISTTRFPSNWELSGDRASGVLRYLHGTASIPYQKMSATGYADTDPRVPYSNPKALTINRRVEIVVLANLDNAAGRAVENLGNTEKAKAEKAKAATARTATGG